MPEHKAVQIVPGSIAGHYEALYPVHFIVRAPEILPVLRASEVFVCNFSLSKTAGHRSYGIVAQGVFHGAVSCPGDAPGNIAQSVILFEPSPSVCLVVAGRNFCILYHCLQSQIVIYALQTLHKRIGNDYLGIGASLCAAVRVAASGIGHIAVHKIDVQKGIHYIPLSVRIEKGNHRRRGAIGVPDCIVVIIIDSVAALNFTGPVNGHQHSVVQSRIVHPQILLPSE